MRSTEFANGEYYHIFNRGVDKRDIFLDDYDYFRFLKSMREFNRKEQIGSLYCLSKKPQPKPLRAFRRPLGASVENKLVEFIAYCLNPNHYHFIVRQLVEGGISKFMMKLGSGYTHYFNQKYDRSGSLLQGTFKAKYITSDAYLLWASVYVNANAEIHNPNQKAKQYKWCSCPDYLGQRNGTLCEKSVILGQFNDVDDYEQYIRESLPLIKENKESWD